MGACDEGIRLLQKRISLFMKDDIPELAESFLVNISGVELVEGSEGAGQPTVKRPGMEVAEVTISENDDPRGILQLNVSDVSTLSLQTPLDNSQILPVFKCVIKIILGIRRNCEGL